MDQQFHQADILSQLLNQAEQIQRLSLSQTEYLESIDNAMQQLVRNGRNTSANNARNNVPPGSGGYHADYRSGQGSRSRGFRASADQFGSAFNASFKKTMVDEVFGTSFKERMRSVMGHFADELGVNIKDIPKEFGEKLGKLAADAFKDSKLGKKLTEKLSSHISAGLKLGKGAFDVGKGGFTAAKAGGATTGKAIGAGIIGAGSFMATHGGSIAKVAGGLMSAGPAGWAALAIGVVGVAIAIKTMGPAIKGTVELFKGLNRAGNREAESRKKNLELSIKRMEADVRAMIEAPFEILKKSADQVYQAWDQNVRLINATQGYTKADLQTLMSDFAAKLQAEELSGTISGTDLINNLTKVLESGLSGAAAESFAYIATKLNAAIPTQDFFGYAGTYSSLAARAIASGASQSSAIEYANQQMELFASNVLYASRQLSDGFTTGLRDAQSLFDQSVQIAQASKTGNPAQIAGVLTSVAAITGSFAPHLSSSIVDAVVKAATGGNESSLVALRSLAGINASNTAFLKALSTNPQQIFSALFSKLAEYQNMSNESYMEVAEGLSSVFGISMEAFTMIPFDKVADAVSQMSISEASLNENISLLSSGETTTTAAKLLNEQVNKYMFEEGLAYVMDNEVARMIQENMWEEQRARELMEAEYSVDLKGKGLQFLEGIRQTIENIAGLLNPFKFLKKVVNLTGTVGEAAAQDKDLKQLLELGKVGSGNRDSLYQLTTRNAALNIADDLLSRMGGSSAYAKASSTRQATIGGINEYYMGAGGRLKFFTDVLSGGPLAPFPTYIDNLDNLLQGASSTGKKTLLGKWDALTGTPRPTSSGVVPGGKATSLYKWGGVGKTSGGLSLGAMTGAPAASSLSALVATTTSQAQASADANFQRMVDSIPELAKTMGYEEWAQSSKSYGIANFEAAMEAAGFTENQLRDAFDTTTSRMAAEDESNRRKREDEFWDTSISEFKLSNFWLEGIYDTSKSFYEAWVDYFVHHTAYRSAYSHEAVSDIKMREASGSEDAIYALADALTQNSVDLLDPAVQTNALLSQILKVLAIMMNQNNIRGAGLTLPDNLSAMALGFK